MEFPVGLPITAGPDAFDCLPAKEGSTPVKSLPSVLYYLGQNQTPLSHSQQLSKISRFDKVSETRLQTPESMHSGRPASCVFRISKTPSSGGNGQGNQIYHNPFEADLVDSLHGPMFSPNVFKTSTPGFGGTAKFQWSIDDIAVLKPVDIEEHRLHDAWNSGGMNSEVEERVQKAIDKYFSSHVIVPSPWTDSSKKKPFVLPATPGDSFADSPMVFCAKSIAEKSGFTPQKLSSAIQEYHSNQPVKKEVASQTALTFPVDFYLEALIGSRYIYQEPETCLAPPVARLTSCPDDEEGNSMDAMNNSSLRCKLFFHGDKGTPISPVRKSKNHSGSERSLSPSGLLPNGLHKPPLSGSGCDGQGSTELADLSLIEHFSSSPIKVVHASPTYRRCSMTSLIMDSPTFSPIRADGCTPISCGSPKNHALAVMATAWTAENHQNSELQMPSSNSAGKRGRILSTDAMVDDFSISCSDQLGLTESGEIMGAALRTMNKMSKSDDVPDNAAAPHLVNAHSEASSEPQGPIPWESQSCSTSLPVVSSDTGYQSNFLQVTGLASSNATECYSIQHDLLPSMLAEEMSCDSFFTNSFCPVVNPYVI